MFVGHYSAAFAAKAWKRTIPLWVLFLAAQLVDVFWAIFVVAGVEKLRIVPGLMAASSLDLYYMPYTHSLVGALIWSVLGSVGYYLLARERVGGAAFVVGLTVFSHWIADLVVHRPDLPLLTDSSPKFGLGLWNFFWPEFALEIALVGGTVAWWLSGERSQATRRAGWVLFGLLVVCQCVDKFGPAPETPVKMALSALAIYLVLSGVAWWAAKPRMVRA